MSTKPFVLFKRVEIDLEGERNRIKKAFRRHKQQREALLKLCDLFEAGKWQECLDHINDDKNFPYDEDKEYSTREHIGIEVGNTLRDMAFENYYTQKDLLEQAEKFLKKEAKEKRAKK